MENVKLKQCANCKKEIEESKLMLHEVSCSRMFKYCDICKDAVEISQFDEEEHLSKHKENKTENKKTIASTSNINNIKSDRGTSNTVNCQFCELQISLSDQKTHEAQCGARTETCEYCNKKMLVKQLKSHLESCVARMALEQGDLDEEYNINEISEDNPRDVDALAKKLAQEEDERMAQLLANQEMKYDPNEDERIARLLAGQAEETDDVLVRKMQMELDEKLANEMANETYGNLNSNLNPEDEMDENLKRVLELSKNNK